MAVLLKVNGRDLSRYIMVAHEEGLDPVNKDRIDPQYSGSTAFQDGMEWQRDAVGNNEQAFPLVLKAASTTALHELISSIEGDLFRGAKVEFALNADTDSSTFFDLERGQLEYNFQFWLGRNGLLRCILRLTSKPFGNTGTQRTVASITGTGPQAFLATGIDGDRRALGNLEVRVGSRVASSGRVIGYGVHPHPSFNPMHVASDGLLTAQSSSAASGAAGALASKYYQIPISPTGASGVAVTDYLTPPAAHVGRHRVFAVARSGLSKPIALYGRDRSGARIGPTALATQIDTSKWQLVDLGEVQVQSRMQGQEPVPTQLVEVIAGGASGAVINASPAFHLAGLMYLPLDESPGIIRTAGADGDSLLASDEFSRLNVNVTLDGYPQAQGALWSKIFGMAGHGGLPGEGPAGPGFPGKVYAVDPTTQKLAGNASGVFSLASGTLRGNVQLEAKVSLAGMATVAAATNAAVTLYPAGLHVLGLVVGVPGARLLPGPSQTLQIVSEIVSGSGITSASVIASAGIATTLASGLYAGQEHKLIARLTGPCMEVWLATAPTGNPILSASNAAFVTDGYPIVRMNAPTNVASAVLALSDIRYSLTAASAPDAAARQHFRFESYPEGRAIQSNASVFVADRAADFRGEYLRLPPAGASLVASGPAKVFVFEGDVSDFMANELIDVTLTATEQFTYLR